MRGPETESEDDDDDTPQKKVAAATTTTTSSPNNYSSANRMTPWISKFVVQELKKGNDGTRSKTPTKNRYRMVEILSRGGEFWESNTDKANQKELPPGWLLVSDGEYSIQVVLDETCRSQIWEQCQNDQPDGAYYNNSTNNMYTFWNYSRGSCGILQDFVLRTNGTTNRCELQCRSFQSQPQLKNMIVTKNSIIRNVNECVHVRYALQSHDNATTTTTTSVARRGLVKGNVRQALQNDDLMNAIMQKTNEAIEAEKQKQREWDQLQEQREQERQLQQEQQQQEEVEDDESEDTDKFETQLQDNINYVFSKDDEVGGDKDDDESSCMNIQEMLETQAEDMEVEPPTKGNEESKGQVEEEDTMQKQGIVLEHQSPGQPSQQQGQEGETQEEEEEEEEETEKTIKEKEEEAHGRKRKTTDTQLPRFRRPSRLPLFASFVRQLEDDSISTIVIIDPASQRKEG